MKKGIIKKYSKKFIALVMAGSLVLSTPIGAMAKESDVDKSETVYVNADASGNPTKIVVSEVLKNKDGGATIDDYSNLTDIKNVKGDEEFTQEADGSIVWENLGDDISYEGESSEKLPVSVRVTYYLDGKEVDPEDIAGKSGKVKIRFDYENNETETVKVDDEDVTVATPFTVITAMVLPGDNFSNIKVENGKVISDGSKNIIIGLGFPGLAESLKLSDFEATEDVEIPSYVEVTADATDFETTLSASIVTSGLMDDMDLDDLDDADDLTSDIDELTDASTQLVDGTSELAEGLETLNSSMGTYSKGVTSLDTGIKSLKSGIATLNKKKGDLLDGANTIQDGLVALKDGGLTLSDGVNSYTAGVASVETGINNTKSGISKLKSGADSLSDGIEAYTAGADSLKTGLDQLQAGLEKALNQDMQSEISKANDAATKLSSDATTLSKTLADMKDTLASLSELSEKLKTLKSSLGTASAGLSQVDTALKGVKGSLDAIDVSAIEDKAESNANSDARSDAGAELEDVKNALRSALNDTDLSDDKKNEIVDKAIGAFDTDHISVNNVLDGTGLSDKLKQASETLGSAEGSLSTITSGINSAVEQITVPSMPDTSDLQTLLGDMKDQSDILNQFGVNVSGLTSSLGTITTAVSQLQQGATQLTDSDSKLKLGASSLTKGIESLDSGMDQLSKGAGQLTSKNDTLKSGASALASGATKLVSGNSVLVQGIKTFNEGIELLFTGSGDLKDGSAKLVEATKLLTDGTDELSDGGNTLKDGMEEFDNEGISKIADLVGDDLDTVIKNVKAVKEADKQYQSYGGIKSGDKGSVKFIIENEAIESEE